MITAQPERRSMGPLIATIDLLFLMLAFFVLMLFFLQQRQVVTEQRLESAQQQLEAVSEEKTAVERVMEEVRPYLPKVEALQKRERERIRAEQARAERRRVKESQRVEYEVLPDGTIRHEGRAYALEAFARDVIEPLRAKHWLAIRAFARPDTPFGAVVETRKLLLVGQGEFDTYWDNVTPPKEPE